MSLKYEDEFEWVREKKRKRGGSCECHDIEEIFEVGSNLVGSFVLRFTALGCFFFPLVDEHPWKDRPKASSGKIWTDENSDEREILDEAMRQSGQNVRTKHNSELNS